MRRKAMRIFSFLCLALSPFSCAFSIPDTSKVCIVGIGVNYYGSHPQYLSATCRDCEEFCSYYKRILDAKGVSNALFLMLDKRDGRYGESLANSSSECFPTKENLLALFQRLRQTGVGKVEPLDSDDLLVVYYSGHGLGSESGDELSGSMLLPASSSSSSFSSTPSYTSLSIDSLADALEAMPCRVALICDSCYSGNMISHFGDNGEIMEAAEYDCGYESGYEADFSRLSAMSNVSGIFASSAKAESYADEGGAIEEFDGEAHSLFTGFMLSRALGWTHCSDTFCILPASSDTSSGIFTSLKKESVVCGRPLSESTMKSLRLTTSDMLGAFPGYFREASQRSVITTGPCSRILLW